MYTGKRGAHRYGSCHQLPRKNSRCAARTILHSFYSSSFVCHSNSTVRLHGHHLLKSMKRPFPKCPERSSDSAVDSWPLLPIRESAYAPPVERALARATPHASREPIGLEPFCRWCRRLHAAASQLPGSYRIDLVAPLPSRPQVGRKGSTFMTADGIDITIREPS